MSWSVSFAAKGRQAAKRQLERQSNLHPIVRALIDNAIDGAKSPDDAIFLVEGHGHQATRNDYEVTTVNLSVKPVVASDS